MHGLLRIWGGRELQRLPTNHDEMYDLQRQWQKDMWPLQRHGESSGLTVAALDNRHGSRMCLGLTPRRR
jgi:hypothetical protein